MLFEDTHQKWGTAASHIRAGLILREFETKVGRQVLCPRIQLVCDRTELGNIDVVFRFGRIEIVQGGVQNPGRGEKGNGTGQAGRLARKGRQETCFSDIFIVDILGIFGTNVLFAQEDRQAGQRCGESRAIRYRSSNVDHGASKHTDPEHIGTRTPSYASHPPEGLRCASGSGGGATGGKYQQQDLGSATSYCNPPWSYSRSGPKQSIVKSGRKCRWRATRG